MESRSREVARLGRVVARVTLAFYVGAVTNIRLTGYDQRFRSTVASLRANLTELIQAMLHDDCSPVALREFSDRRYVQFWSQTDGRANGEVVASLNFVTTRKSDPRGERRLRELGLREPVSGPNPTGGSPRRAA